MIDYTNIREITIAYSHQVKLKDRIQIKTSRNAYDVFLPYFESILGLREFFYVIFTNRQGRVLGIIKLCEGGTAGCVVDIKLLMVAALKSNANGIIMAHNHPSGMPNATNTDIELTKTIKQACKTLDLILLDHIILLPDQPDYFSIADEGLL